MNTQESLDDILKSGRPYIGRFMHAEQGGARYRYFRPIVEQVRREERPLRILEVGSWAGGSLLAWDEASNRISEFTVVDCWTPYLPRDGSNGDEMTRAADSGDIYKLFLHNIRAVGLQSRLRIMVGYSQDVLPMLQNEYYDIVYIDGNHVFEYVLKDIVNSLLLVRDGGILCGDDLERQFPDISPRHPAALDNGDQYLDRDDSGCGYHPGVTQAVFEVFGRRVSAFDGLWAQQKVGNRWRDVVL